VETEFVEVNKDEETKSKDYAVATSVMTATTTRAYGAIEKNKVNELRSSTLASIRSTTQSPTCPRALLLKNSYSVLED